MLRVKSTWTGFTGSPGYTNLYFGNTSDVTGANSAVSVASDLWDRLHTFFPTGVTVQASQEVEDVDPANGDLLGAFTATASSPAWVGTSPGGYSAASGAVINWRTAGIHRGHRVRGRTFLVPLGATCYQTDGTIIDAIRASMITALTPAVASPLGVWARPFGPPPVVAGAFFDVISASIPDKSAVLRSRRD
jgi:hypothetical protein